MRRIRKDPLMAISSCIVLLVAFAGIGYLPSPAAAAVSAFFTSIAGSFYAQFVGYIDPESVMGFQFSLLMALPAVLGGIGTLWGPLLGAVILIPLTELTRSFIGGSGRGVDLIVYGGLIIAISLARPQGLVGLFSPRRKEAAR